VRRALPWALVALVVAGAGLGMGIGLGTQGASTQAQISQILRTTENAGTARFTVTELTTSTSPGLASDFVESGEINFRTGDIDVTTRDAPSNAGAGTGPGSDLSEMRILVTRNSLIIFEKIPAVGLLGTSWAKDEVTSSSRERAEIEGSFGPFAALQVSSSAHITRFEAIDHQSLRGEQTTEYLERTSACQSKTKGGSLNISSGAANFWVDGAGRYVQGESTLRLMSRTVTNSGTTSSRSSTTITDRLYDFGAPVTIKIPPSVNSGLSLFFEGGRCAG